VTTWFVTGLRELPIPQDRVFSDMSEQVSGIMEVAAGWLSAAGDRFFTLKHFLPAVTFSEYRHSASCCSIVIGSSGPLKILPSGISQQEE